MSWEKVNFLDVVKDITGGNRKFLGSEYETEGLYPIIDQGVTLVGGYTDSNEVVNRTKAVVVFGDHTKALKFLDFDFCLGADGVKILQPDDMLDSKFLYYYLGMIQLPDVGYSRHYKFLKEIKIPLPPLPIQKKIADILDKADALRKKDQQLLQKYDELAQAIFIDMFGDPVKNEKGWEVKKMGECLDKIQIGPFGTQLHESDYISDGVPLINPMHIGNLKIKPNYKYSISKEKFEELPQYHLIEGDVILARRGEMGRCAIVTGLEAGYLCGTGSLFLKATKAKLDPHFLVYFLSRESTKESLERSAAGAIMANLNKTILQNFEIILPPIKLQITFRNSILINQQSIDLMKDNIQISESLFQSLLQQAFKGELIA